MMGPAVLILTLLLAVLLAAAFLLGRHLSQRQYLRDELSPVSRQHIDLFQGGHLSEAAVESAKARFRELLERGEVAAVEASLRAGMLFVVQVRALAELGTETAGHILERQLHRRLTDDQIEQSWYWIDLANGLRALNRSQSLPHLLRCAEQACDKPLGHFFAAETVCFLGFSGYLTHDRRSPLGRAALRVLHRALEGLRCGVPPQVVAEARLGEMVEGLWDRRDEEPDPLVVRIFHEALRVLRRAPHAEGLLGIEVPEQEAFNWQVSRLAALEPVLGDYLQETPSRLSGRLGNAGPAEQRDLLLALNDLHAEAGTAILSLLSQPDFPHVPLAIEVLAWSKDARVGSWLREWTMQKVPLLRRSQKRRRSLPPRRPSLPADLPYKEVLYALRGHASPQTESFLLSAARDWDPTYRAAAVASLGWWEPLSRSEVLLTLADARRDPNPEVRQSGRAALARLGERQALHWFRQTLASEDPQRVHETIQLVALEGLTLLWPDLDRLADAEDADIAHHARESLERLCEELDRRRP
ncbi:MAG: HEAT repeat domain-containing protein [Planctomycetes bacterium]|nr:HEAT repeat domain-containing protein [Planctomycetota bacterium]